MKIIKTKGFLPGVKFSDFKELSESEIVDENIIYIAGYTTNEEGNLENIRVDSNLIGGGGSQSIELSTLAATEYGGKLEINEGKITLDSNFPLYHRLVLSTLYVVKCKVNDEEFIPNIRYGENLIEVTLYDTNKKPSYFNDETVVKLILSTKK